MAVKVASMSLIRGLNNNFAVVATKMKDPFQSMSYLEMNEI